jgi:hypothetical protein
MFTAAGIMGGCADNPPPVERVPVAAPDGDVRRGYDRAKPLPEQSRLYDRDIPPEPPFDDPPLVNQKTPEQGRFEQAYRGVGRPRIAVFVNRTLEGAILPANKEGGATGRDDARRADRYGEPRYDRPYLKHGEYDEAGARSLDYEAVENILTDFLACQGTIEIMSPTMARQRLNDEQVKDLQSGRPQAMREIAQQLDTDVLVQVTAHPTRQTPYGLEFRLVGEALNIKGGQQVGRAVVDIPPPLDKPTLNRYTRFMARKLMMDMTQSWSSTEPAPAPRNAPPAAPEPEKK